MMAIPLFRLCLPHPSDENVPIDLMSEKVIHDYDADGVIIVGGFQCGQ